MDVLFFTLLTLVCVLLLEIFSVDVESSIVFFAAFLALHLWNFLTKQSRSVAFLGCIGAVSFGLAFYVSAIFLFQGEKGYLGEGWPWWRLRDQIIGLIGGLAIVFSIHRYRSVEFPSAPTKTTKSLETGLMLWLLAIPLLNTANVIDYWWRETEILSRFVGMSLLGIVIFTYLFSFLTLQKLSSVFIRHPQWKIPLGHFTLLWFVYLSALAISKQVIPRGLNAWEDAYTLFLLGVCVLSLFFAFKNTLKR